MAVKQIRADVLSSAHQDSGQFLAEVKVMASLRKHPNVVQLVGVCVDQPPDLYLVVEHFAVGSLHDLLYNPRQVKQLRPLVTRHLLALDIAAGLDCLHAEGILHGDLAARNILLRQQDNRLLGCVADFGLATKLQHGATGASLASRPIPVRWSAPEVLRAVMQGTSSAATYQKASDMWSYGVVLYELHALGAVREPYADLATNDDVISAVVSQRRVLPQPKECPNGAYEIMVQCWAYVPEQRPTTAEVRRLFKVVGKDS